MALPHFLEIPEYHKLTQKLSEHKPRFIHYYHQKDPTHFQSPKNQLPASAGFAPQQQWRNGAERTIVAALQAAGYASEDYTS